MCALCAIQLIYERSLLLSAARFHTRPDRVSGTVIDGPAPGRAVELPPSGDQTALAKTHHQSHPSPPYRALSQSSCLGQLALGRQTTAQLVPARIHCECGVSPSHLRGTKVENTIEDMQPSRAQHSSSTAQNSQIWRHMGAMRRVSQSFATRTRIGLNYDGSPAGDTTTAV